VAYPDLFAVHSSGAVRTYFFRKIMAEVQPSTDDILMNPLRGEVFRLSSYISSGITSGRQRGSMSSASSGEYTISRM